MTAKKHSDIDLLNGPIMKSLLLFMVPIMLSNAFQQLYNAADTAIIGNYLGENSLAAVGACSSIFELFVGFSLSLGGGFGIVTARSYGSGDYKKLKQTVAGALVIGLFTTILITILSTAFLRPLLAVINTPEEIFEESYTYIRLIALCISVTFAYNLLSGLLRAIGNSMMPLVFLIFSSVLNVVLDIMFISTFHMGIAGAAIATVISQAISVVLCFLYILKRTPILIPSREDFKVDVPLWKDLAGQGYSMAVMGSIVSCGSIILQSGINSLGTSLIAGHVAARKVYAICNLPFVSMGVAMSTFIGQNKGAGQGDRIVKGIRMAYIFDIIAAGAVSVFLWLTAPAMVGLISGSTNAVIIENGSLMLYIVGPFYSVLGILMVTRYALQGLGSKVLPLISSVIEFIGKVLFTTLLIPAFGYNAVVWCEPIIWCFMTAQLLFCYVRNPYIKEAKKQMKNA